MKLHIISIGKLSDSFADICKKYQKMTSWDIKNIELPHSKKSDINEIKKDEANNILKKIPEKSYVIVLDVKGGQLGSIEFSKLLQKQMLNSKEVTFIIGGAFGLTDNVLEKAHSRISLSAMTLPHQFAKTILMEQIYRAFSILNNHPYHK